MWIHEKQYGYEEALWPSVAAYLSSCLLFPLKPKLTFWGYATVGKRTYFSVIHVLYFNRYHDNTSLI